jgi:Helicase conserved C-terminal domain
MADLMTLQGFDHDTRQEAKEAVCDAVLERVRQVVSGEGDFGAIVLGDRPSRVLSSGFVLPGVNVDGDDETGDIHIASHGLDLRVRGNDGIIRIRPSFFVYVRGLPSSEELFARDGRLVPKADFSPVAGAQAKQTIRARAGAEIPAGTPRDERVRRRAAITREVYANMGVHVPAEATLPGGDERDAGQQGIDDAVAPPPVAGGRLRIPDAISHQYKIPEKWIRIMVDIPLLELPFPCDPSEWADRAATHADLLRQAVQDSCNAWLASPEGQRDAWRRLRPPSEAFWEPARWDAFLAVARQSQPTPGDVVPPIDARVLAQALPEPAAPECFSLRVAIENVQERDEDHECGLFGVSLLIELPEAALGRMRLERVRRSYHLAGLMTMPAIGVNGGVDDLGLAGDVRTLRTTWMPRYVLPRMRARTLRAVPTSYIGLADEKTDVAGLSALPDTMDGWRRQVAATQRLSKPGEDGTAADEAAQRIRFSEDLLAWEREAGRVRKGVDVIIRSRSAWSEEPGSPAAIPYRAWLLLNRTFADANPVKPNEGPSAWRLFQLAFILAHIPTLTSRIPGLESDFDPAFDEDAASLLYMSTGGGKTEAFFGVVVYALFLDRLRGKKRGITAMMHYPLRLLTVQQAQRLSRLLARAELLRQARRVGGAPFEIGFWVGGTNTPNRTESRNGSVDSSIAFIPAWSDSRAKDENVLMTGSSSEDKAYIVAKESWNKLPTCPFCSAEAGTALRRFPKKHNAIGIVCLEPSCEWNRIHRNAPEHAPTPLPFWIADTDIYRRAPSVLLGTIDKLALLGQDVGTVSKIAGMLGLARWREGGPDGTFEMPSGLEASAVPPGGSERLKPAFKDGEEAFFDPFPSLIVQDEMHLLEESLGTFGGIFETGLLTWLKHIAPILETRACRWQGAPDQPRLPHIIGATATAADAAKHVRTIYTRGVIQFPHPGPGLHEGFYVGLSAFAPEGAAATARSAPDTPRGREAAAPWGRVYASLMTNGRRHTVTTLAVLATHAATITRWQRDLSAPDPERRRRAAVEMEHSMSAAPWADRRRTSIRALATTGQYSVLADLVDLHRIMLTYVTNKKGGDQILSALEQEARESHAAMGSVYALDKFHTTLISGGIDIGTIQAVIRDAERSFDPMVDNIADVLRCIVATSAISHGVDVEAFNAMAFAGMPADVAEYIQASSRVGRSHVGFSLLLPTPQTRRDRFVVEVHESFHRLLERMIAPPAIERWADRAIERTIPSLVQTWLSGVLFQTQFANACSDRKSDVPDTVDKVRTLLSAPGAFDACVAFVQEAIAIDVSAAKGGPVNPQYYRDLVRGEIERIVNTIRGGEFSGWFSEFWRNPSNNLRAPMTSLRDVDEPGKIWASPNGIDNSPVSFEQVTTAMAVIRNRGAGRKRRAAVSEIDTEGLL